MLTTSNGLSYEQHPQPLLSVREVAELLGIGVQTVYNRRDLLGGFFPAGLRVLRFRPEVIHEFMEGSGARALVLQLPASGKNLRRTRFCNKTRGSRSKGGEAYIRQIGGTDPSRHGL